MTQPRCPRLWEVEALRDGRLHGRAATAAEAHVAGCKPCGEERLKGNALAEALRSLQPRVNEVALRRIRQHTLAFADRALRSPAHGRLTRQHLGWIFVAAAVLLFVGFGALPDWPHKASEIADIQATPGTTWKRSLADGLDRVELADGTLRISVHRLAGNPRVVLRVPDGEIEDVGTRFRVWVQGGRTREIAVTEGRVIFRRFGADAVSVGNGEVWRSVDDVVNVPPPAPATDGREPQAASSQRVVPKPPGAMPKNTAKIAGSASSAAPSVKGADDSSAAEDLAYLQIATLLREHRNEEARLAAQDYLHKFPNGFRRVEVSRVASAGR